MSHSCYGSVTGFSLPFAVFAGLGARECDGFNSNRVLAEPVNENKHPRGFAGLTGNITALDESDRKLLGFPTDRRYRVGPIVPPSLSFGPATRHNGSAKGMVFARPRGQGKFLFVGEEQIYIRGVTYGTLRPNGEG